MLLKSLQYPLYGGIERIFQTLKIDPRKTSHLKLYSIQLSLLPFCADRPHWWTMGTTDGCSQYVKVDIKPAFIGNTSCRITRNITFLDCFEEVSQESIKVARRNQIELVELLFDCPGKALAIRAKSKPARILNLASDLIFRSANKNICDSELQSRFRKLIKITKGSQ